MTTPEFSGRSYLSLPTLTNAYSDLQLSMEFRPASSSSSVQVLLLTGENRDMTGDYLALLIRGGRVELRLEDCLIMGARFVLWQWGVGDTIHTTVIHAL